MPTKVHHPPEMMKRFPFFAAALSLIMVVNGDRSFDIVFDHNVEDYRILPANKRKFPS